jgi:hypothetical protein
LRLSIITRGGLLRMVLVLECIQLDVSTVRHCVEVGAWLVLPTAVFVIHSRTLRSERFSNGEENAQECPRLVRFRLGEISTRLVVSESDRAFSRRDLPPARGRTGLEFYSSWSYLEPVLHSSIPTRCFRFC